MAITSMMIKKKKKIMIIMYMKGEENKDPFRKSLVSEGQRRPLIPVVKDYTALLSTSFLSHL
jgi:hypothetical protein